MFCSKCGAENANDAKFCVKCGSPLGNDGRQSAGTTPPPAPAGGASQADDTPKAPVSMPKLPGGGMNQMMDKLKAIPAKLLIGVGAAVVALIIVICVAVNAGNTINLNKYFTVEADGYDGYGRASAVIDWDEIEDKYGSKISYTSAAKKEFGGMLNMMEPFDAFRECVGLRLDETSGLSNGDTVEYTWNIDEDMSKYLKCKVKYKDGEYTVSGLTQVGTFDAFADLTVEFYGVAPNGEANLNYIGSELDSYNFDCSETRGLSNGDTITVSIDESVVERCAEKYGEVPEIMEKQYTVEGLEKYLTRLDEIDSGSLEAMKSQGSDVFQAYVAKNWDVSLDSFEYIGSYLLTAKNKEARSGNNYLFLVFKAQSRNTYSNDEEYFDQYISDYWYIRFDDLLVSGDGTINVDLTDYTTPNDSFKVDSGVSKGWFSTMAWSYKGYNTLDDLYKAVVMQNLDSYNHEDLVDESVAPDLVIETVVEEQPEETDAEEEAEADETGEETSEVDAEEAEEGEAEEAEAENSEDA